MSVYREGNYLLYRVKEEDLPASAGQLLKRRLHLTEHQIRRAKFRPDGILRNGQQVRVTCPMKAGDLLCAAVADPDIQGAEYNPVQEPGLEVKEVILYEDADLLAVNKPMGMAVHRGRGHYGDTLADQVQTYLQRASAEDGEACPAALPTIHVVGRLDRDTSGIVVFAKNAVAAQRLSQQTRDEHFKKYLAIVEGTLTAEEILTFAPYAEITDDACTIRLPIRKRADRLNEMEAAALPEGTEGWMEAETRIRILGGAGEAGRGVTLIEAVPITGRTHQIRVHMAALGHPLLGDPIYGQGQLYPEEETKLQEEGSLLKSGNPRAAKNLRTPQTQSCMYLHCAEAHLRHPFTGEPMVLRASRPC